MKKIIVLSVMAALICALGAPAAFAGVQGSRHDMASGSLPAGYASTLGALDIYGTCSACHLPHGAGAERLFPSKSVAAVGGFFAPLCGSCHDENIVTTGGGDVHFNQTVIQPNAHGLSNSILAGYGNHDGVASGAAATAGLTYLTSAQSPRTPQVDEIECLSCHDVHNQNGFRPFMEIALDDLCEACHLNRVNAATGTTGWANAGFGGGSTHPSGSGFTGDVSGIATPVTSNSPFNVAGIDATLVSNPDAGAAGSDWGDGPWDSGMQLEAQAAATWGSGGVDCITCHNVHWDEDDATPYNGSNYLGIVFDNLGGPANDFCEFCHRGPNAVPADMQGTEGNPATSLYFWNPGGQAYSHPNDDVGSVDDAIQASDLNLPLGLRAPTSSRIGTARSGIVCTSCHGIHPTDSTTPETENASPILLNYDETAYGDVCEACHDTTAAAAFQHHPVGTAYVTAGNDAGSPPSAGLTCAGGIVGGTPQNQCHGAGGGTANGGWMAHNRTAALGAPPTLDSAMCTDCHTVNPSTYTPANTYTANELASHYVGSVLAWPATRSTDCGTNGITFAGSGCSDGATAVNWSGSGLPSLFGAAVSDIICESCHRLAAGNVASGNRTADPVALLVEVSGHDIETINEADAVQGAADYTGAVYMCTGCHHVPSGTHPLLEADGSQYQLASGATGHRYTTSLVAGSVNCESCHSPHDAETQTGSFILDAGATSGGGVTGMEPHPALDYTGFCAVCHGGFN